MALITRKAGRLVFECPSPSVWVLVGAYAVLAFTGSTWLLSMTDRSGVYREGQYKNRDEAIAFLRRYYAA